MRTVNDLEVSCAEFKPPEVESPRGLFERLEQKKLLVVVFAVAVAFSARVYQLGEPSLAEDEANKIFAVRVYEQGDFTVNTEHPMVMKALCYASVHAMGLWNKTAGDALNFTISEEAALRLPNALFGALTVIPLLMLATALLDFKTGLIATLLWAIGIDAVWFNRIVKEDSLLVFFMFCGFWLYNRAKSLPASDVKRQERLYAFSGAAFGLMMASKYFPHYFGLNALYYTLIGYDSRNNRPLTRRMWAKYFGGLFAAFTLSNPSLFAPQTIRHLLRYVNEDILTHHGYVVMGKIFLNDMGETPGGNPWYFYFLFLLVKLPLPILLAFLIGLAEIFRRRAPYPASRGYLFLRMTLICWLLPMSLMGVKFTRYTLSLMPLVYLTAAIGIIVSWRALTSGLLRMSFGRQSSAAASSAPALSAAVSSVAVAAFFIIAPAITMIRAMPNPGLYVNALGGGRAGYFFPHDEFYDLGARESIRFIAETAPPGARMASEIPGVVEYYLERYKRPDIQSEIISQPSFTLSEGRPDFVLLQPGRLYFENKDNYNLIEKSFPVVQSSVYEGAAAARVYFVGGRAAGDEEQ
jgi:dolichyl-phosphate-mannose-protein mannosyltransferase/glycosyl transferase family 22 (putative mannosyltransferase)